MEDSDDNKKVNDTKHRQENDKEEEIWSWGAGTEGQLGTGSLHDEHFPQLLRLHRHHSLSSSAANAAAVGPISLLSCGGAHAIALTSAGKVLSWGRGNSGQLGHGETLSNSPSPKLVTLLESFVITHVSAGWNHSGFVSDSGSLFTCGDGSFGQLGHGNYKSHCSPVKVSYFVDKHVEQIACGMRHSLVLLKGHSGDRVYAFGSGKRGQLGVSKDKIKLVSLPQVTCGLEGVEVVSIKANGDHSAALTADGHLYTWGRGFPGNSDARCPTYLPASSSFTNAALGWNHALLLTGSGEAFMLGGNHHGVLSDPDKMSSAKHLLDSKEGVLERVTGLEGQKVVDIAAGAEHSALVTENGAVKTWGWGEHGQLGLGDTCDQISPQEVSLSHKIPSEASETKVYCGSGFTISIRTPNVPFRPDQTLLIS